MSNKTAFGGDTFSEFHFYEIPEISTNSITTFSALIWEMARGRDFIASGGITAKQKQREKEKTDRPSEN